MFVVVFMLQILFCEGLEVQMNAFIRKLYDYDTDLNAGKLRYFKD